METTNDTAAIESLQAFALAHGEIAFAHLCTAALNGEKRAASMVKEANESIAVEEMDLVSGSKALRRQAVDKIMLRTIRATDTTRPDGAIARSFRL
jgi:hypothetical protein